MRCVYNFFGGRSTTFAWLFSIAGVVALFMRLLTGHEFVLLVGAVHTFVIVRAISEDRKPPAAADGRAAT